MEIPWETLEKRSGNLEGSGEFIGLQVIKKNISGAVTGMEIVTENKSIQLEGEYEIRQFLSPAVFDYRKRWKYCERQ